MASTNKTTNLELNNWIGGDRSQREDFNSDNEKIDTWAGRVNSQLNENVQNIEQISASKLDKDYKIKSTDMDLSNEDNKLGLINLKDEVIETISNPLRKILNYPGTEIIKGFDYNGNTESNPVGKENLYLINKEKIKVNGEKIQVKTNFDSKILVSCYKEGIWIGIIDFKQYLENFIDVLAGTTDINLTITHTDDSNIINGDIVEIYKGSGKVSYTFENGSVTSEKIADQAVKPQKINMPISTLIPWNNDIIITPASKDVDSEIVTFPINSIFSSTSGKYCILNKKTSITIPDGYICYLDWDDRWINEPLPDNSIKIEKATEFSTSFHKHILFANFSGRLLSHISSYNKKCDEIYNGNSYLNFNNVVIVDKNCKGNYKTINEALSSVNDSAENPITILVMPGVYKEVVNVYGNRHISIIGVNKKDCIIRNDTGKYLDTPLRIEGECYIANLTIISTHDENTDPVDSLRAYAVHPDDWGEGTAEFNNCVMISYQNAAFGCGLHTNQTVKLINCELYSYTPNESSMTGNGALFCHDGENGTNQHLIVKGCIIKSINSYSMYLNGHYKTEMDASFYNNMFFSNELKKDSMHFDEGVDGGISGRIKITEDSYGNNIDDLNK